MKQGSRRQTRLAFVSGFSSLGVFTAVSPASVLASTYSPDRSCPAGGQFHPDRLSGANDTVDENDVFGGRIPTANSLRMSAACKQKALDKINEFRQKDQENAAALIDRAFSYKNGWVLKQGQSCSVGCLCCVANHWERDISRAQYAWAAEKRAILLARFTEMKEAACSCWSAELQSAFMSADAPSAESDPSSLFLPDSPLAQANLFTEPSSAGEPEAIKEALRDSVVEKVVGAGAKTGMKRALESNAVKSALISIPRTVAALRKLAKFAPVFGAAFTAYDYAASSQPMASENQPYSNGFNRAFSGANTSVSWLRAFEDYRMKRPTKLNPDIYDNLAASLSLMGKGVQEMQDGYRFTSTHLPQGYCQQAFEIQHRTFVRVFSRLTGQIAQAMVEVKPHVGNQ